MEQTKLLLPIRTTRLYIYLIPHNVGHSIYHYVSKLLPKIQINGTQTCTLAKELPIPSVSKARMRNVAIPSRSSFREWWKIWIRYILSIKTSHRKIWPVKESLACTAVVFRPVKGATDVSTALVEQSLFVPLYSAATLSMSWWSQVLDSQRKPNRDVKLVLFTAQKSSTKIHTVMLTGLCFIVVAHKSYTKKVYYWNAKVQTIVTYQLKLISAHKHPLLTSSISNHAISRPI